MKRIIASAAAMCLLLGGCGVIKESDTQGASVSVSELDLSDNQYTGRVETTAVYFLNKTSGTLTAELRRLELDQDVNPAEVAVEALLEGPSNNEELAGVAPQGMTLDYIEFSRGVANVYLLYNGEEMQPEDRYILEGALANTITDMLGASYICFFYNGMTSGYFGVPAAPMQKQTGRINDAWVAAEAAYQLGVPVVQEDLPEEDGETDTTDAEEDTILTEDLPPAEPVQTTMSTVLYFVSSDGGYILPEVRSITYTDGDYFAALFRELQIGPQNESIMASPIADDLTFEEPVLTETGDGSYTVTLRFSSLPTQYDDPDEDQALRSYAAIIYTITGLVPDIASVQIYVKDTLITLPGIVGDSGMRRDDFIGYIGSSAPIYFEDTESDLLIEVPRSMEQRAIWSAKARLLEVFEGPISGDGDNVDSVMPAGVSADDILSVEVYTDTAYVNLSQNFKDACAGRSAKNEMRLVFSFVNTITAIDGINKVQFLIEGQQTMELAGTLCVADPFLRNYGIIKQTG